MPLGVFILLASLVTLAISLEKHSFQDDLWGHSAQILMIICAICFLVFGEISLSSLGRAEGVIIDGLLFGVASSFVLSGACAAFSYWKTKKEKKFVFFATKSILWIHFFALLSIGMIIVFFE